MDDFGNDIMLPWSAYEWHRTQKVVEPFNYGSMVYFKCPEALAELVFE